MIELHQIFRHTAQLLCLGKCAHGVGGVIVGCVSKTQIIVTVAVVWVILDGRLIIPNGVIVALHRHIGVARALVGIRILWIQFDGLQSQIQRFPVLLVQKRQTRIG